MHDIDIVLSLSLVTCGVVLQTSCLGIIVIILSTINFSLPLFYLPRVNHCCVTKCSRSHFPSDGMVSPSRIRSCSVTREFPGLQLVLAVCTVHGSRSSLSSSLMKAEFCLCARQLTGGYFKLRLLQDSTRFVKFSFQRVDLF